MLLTTTVSLSRICWTRASLAVDIDMKRDPGSGSGSGLGSGPGSG